MGAVLVDLGGSYLRVSLAGDDLLNMPMYRRPVRLVEADANLAKAHPLEFAIRAALAERGLSDPAGWPADLWLSLPCDPGDGLIQFEKLGSIWNFKRVALRERFGFKRVTALNDFEAVAWAIPPLIEDGYLAPVGPIGSPQSRGRMVVLGPGTALGAAGLIPDSAGFFLPVRTEFGHAQARLEKEEARLLRKIRAAIRTSGDDSARLRYGLSQDEPVTSAKMYRREYLASGPGMARMYDASLPPRQTISDAKAIVRSAIRSVEGAEPDPLAEQIVGSFCRLLGKHAAELAATFTARGMVLLVGPIVNALGPRHLERFGFRTSFEDWLERADKFPKNVPTMIVTHPNVGLAGLARLAKTVEDAKKKE